MFAIKPHYYGLYNIYIMKPEIKPKIIDKKYAV